MRCIKKTLQKSHGKSVIYGDTAFHPRPIDRWQQLTFNVRTVGFSLSAASYMELNFARDEWTRDLHQKNSRF